MPSNSTIPLPQPAPLVAVPTTPPRTTIPLLQSAPVDVGVVLAQTPPGVASTLLNPAPTTSPDTAVLPQSTPIKTGVSTTFPFTTTQKFRIPSCTAMATEMKGYLVGPMPVQEFLEDFFPTGELPGLDAVPVFTHDCYRRTVNAKKETAAYKPFVQTTQKFTPNLRIVNSSSTVDRNPHLDFPFKIKPDVSVYRSDSDLDVISDSASSEIFIEFKWKPSDDPFCDVRNVQRSLPSGEDTVKSFLRGTKSADDTLGQITAYAAAQLGSQFRTHVYSVLIVKNTARILRWDRSGTIVTEAIEYNESPLLAEFFRRYSTAPPEMRGADQTVSVPTPAEAAAAREALKLDDTTPLVKLEIPSIDGTSHYFVTSTPRATLYTPPGRATRGFQAYNISQGTLVFLKDSWRVDLPDIQAEGLTYETLRKAAVRNVPHCLVSGDISTAKYHSTKTFAYTTKPWACYTDTHFIPHRHYRLALDIIGRSLTTFESSYQLVATVRDSLIALRDAYGAGILHCDFSPGNIIIGPDGSGRLIDWDLSKPLALASTSSETPRRATRTGTWQFMSARLIAHMVGSHDFRDDLESSIYVLLWVGLVYSECSDRAQVPSFLSSVLDPQPHGSIGGYGKADFLKGKTFLTQVKFSCRPAFDTLLNRLADLFAVRYEVAPTDSERADSDRLWARVGSDPYLRSLYSKSQTVIYDQRMHDLSSHDATIALFETALSDRSQWPANDRAEKQQIRIDNMPSPHQQLMKTGWSTTLIIQELRSNPDIEAALSDSVNEGDGDYQMVEVESSSDTSSSDQMTVDGHSPPLLPKDLES